MTDSSKLRRRAASRRLLTDALIAALRAGTLNDPTSNAGKVVHALIRKAAEGDLSAIKEIYDRVEGRPLQAAAPEPGEPQEVIFGWKDEKSS
jgi:hypothetical protein